MKKLIELNRNNILTGIADYHRYTDVTDILDDVSDAFVDRLARDNAFAKRDLRELLLSSTAQKLTIPTSSLFKSLPRQFLRLPT